LVPKPIASNAQPAPEAPEGAELMTPTQLHTALLQACPDEVVSAVVKLHAPDDDSSYSLCNGCDWDGYDGPGFWPCRTIRTINAYAHIDGIGAL
jgi:hypothetical protein